MPKHKGKRHSWDRKGKWATCKNCKMKVEARLIKRGGLPACGDVAIPKPKKNIAPKNITPDKPKSYFREYLDSYSSGCSRFGLWWKVFTFSMLGFVVTFITFAVSLVMLFLI